MLLQMVFLNGNNYFHENINHYRFLSVYFLGVNILQHQSIIDMVYGHHARQDLEQQYVVLFHAQLLESHAVTFVLPELFLLWLVFSRLFQRYVSFFRCY